ncbi:hypothetical protein EJD96_11190 [Herbaspirillum seropedicae]|uniref:hypothetical protein n=1 Tax=Herbaspirillum seropedicae TaxID=964 RepID=UPI00111F3463|nr:hypothetical protein [Herbaspirillum seropedicae]QDD64689.1 hypothetical protein EJD96_11190 [Herbaspirillum seropedicae]
MDAIEPTASTESTEPTEPLARQRQDYARELRARFEQYKTWAITHWPVRGQPLEESAFVAAERELELITGTMLHPGGPSQAIPADGDEPGQFQQVTPAPWP